MKILLDTNVIISSIIFGGRARKLLTYLLNSEHEHYMIFLFLIHQLIIIQKLMVRILIQKHKIFMTMTEIYVKRVL